IEDNVNNVFENLVGNVPGAPKLRMDVNNSTLSVGGRFDTPILNGAVYHQSTYNNLLIEGLSATVGLRLEYEKIKLDYNSIADPLNFDFSAIMPPPRPTITSKGLEAPASFVGKISTDYLQLLPKFALQYEWNKGNSVYATVSKGHRSGGYNIQMFSDIAQGGMQNAALDALAQDKNFASFSAMLEKQKKELPDIKEATQYKPEYSWSYEVGSHLTLWEGKLWADLAAFYMDTRDQQISQFAPSGLGRITVNAGKSRSYGAEASLRASLTSALSLNASYGYTYATFTDYVTNQKQDAETLGTSYNGNYVPFVPKHTLNIGGEYAITCSPRSLFDRVVFQANYVGAGRIYWTEQNNASQAFYGTLNGRVNLEVGDAMISFWTRNFLDKDYNAFYFETMNKGFAQQGRPAQFGIDLRCRF
ncbi:TonB-dependent receptor, partial [Bacteroides reticulotermitis]